MDIQKIISSPEWAEFVELLDHHTAHRSFDEKPAPSIWYLEKHVQAMATERGWTDIFPADDNLALRAKLDIFYTTARQRSFGVFRLAQLQNANAPLWVYRGSCERAPTPEHDCWDGLILPVEHPFWKTHFPPNDFGCGCSVYSAYSIASAERRGGKPWVELPEDWQRFRADTGAPRGLHPLFVGQVGPEPHQVLRYVLDGTAKSRNILWP